MHDIAVIGAGNIGSTIAQLLTRCGDYRVTVMDRSEPRLSALEGASGARLQIVDVAETKALTQALAGRFAVINAAPFHLTLPIARAAAAAGTHYLDLTEDVAATRAVSEIARGASTVFAPQCGLAPGFITVVAHDLIQTFERLDAVKLRVGALPQFPSNTLGYNLTWSTEGVINEYCEPCEAIVGGEPMTTLPLEECEGFALDGIGYEAFNTSGGLGSLGQTLRGRVRTLNYKTIRYPGHARMMKTLLHDFGLSGRRDVLKDILESSLPTTLQDVVIVFVTVTGWREGRLAQETYAQKIYAAVVDGVRRSAIQLTTAAGVCATLDLVAEGRARAKGLLLQEEIALQTFLANRFGRLYSGGGEAPNLFAGAPAERTRLSA